MQDRRSSGAATDPARDFARGVPARGVGDGVVVVLDDVRRPAVGDDERRLAERIARFVGPAHRPRPA